jgi:hypothetical protein
MAGQLSGKRVKKIINNRKIRKVIANLLQ